MDSSALPGITRPVEIFTTAWRDSCIEGLQILAFLPAYRRVCPGEHPEAHLALGAFSGATIVTLLGAGLVFYQGAPWFDAMPCGVGAGRLGAGCLIFGSVRLFWATQTRAGQY